jgi:diketogulonate reductase-like aldo/keto reductase
MMNYTAYNNVTIPTFMYGTAWKKDATRQLVELAVASGFRALDTANQIIHYNEALVGEALVALDSKGIKRGTLFLQTKFTPLNGQDNRTPYDASANITTQVGQSFDSSLQHLRTEYVDSYVLHGPYSRLGLGTADWEVWAAMEGIYKTGRTKMIGISNVTAGQLRQLCDKAEIKPMVVQNRCYAVLGWDKEVREICQANQIIYQGFSLLTANRQIWGHPEIGALATRLGTGPAQVIFRFSQQIGILPLTGTTSQQHMKEDLQTESLDLSPEEALRIEMMAV